MTLSCVACDVPARVSIQRILRSFLAFIEHPLHYRNHARVTHNVIIPHLLTLYQPKLNNDPHASGISFIYSEAFKRQFHAGDVN